MTLMRINFCRVHSTLRCTPSFAAADLVPVASNTVAACTVQLSVSRTMGSGRARERLLRCCSGSSQHWQRVRRARDASFADRAPTDDQSRSSFLPFLCIAAHSLSLPSAPSPFPSIEHLSLTAPLQSGSRECHRAIRTCACSRTLSGCDSRKKSSKRRRKCRRSELRSRRLVRAQAGS